MATAMKTPGVYIKEKDAFGNSVVPVATAVPAFIGYTGKTSYSGQSLLNVPVKIRSLTDFTNMYGDKPPLVKFSVNIRPTIAQIEAVAAAGSVKPPSSTPTVTDLATATEQQGIADARLTEALKNVTIASVDADMKAAQEAYDKAIADAKATLDSELAAAGTDEAAIKAANDKYDGAALAAKKTFDPIDAAYNEWAEAQYNLDLWNARLALATAEESLEKLPASEVDTSGANKAVEHANADLNKVIHAQAVKDLADAQVALDVAQKKMNDEAAAGAVDAETAAGFKAAQDDYNAVLATIAATGGGTSSGGGASSSTIDVYNNDSEVKKVIAAYGTKDTDAAGYSKAKEYYINLPRANYTTSDGTGYSLQCSTVNYRMYTALKFFYANGGGDAYIISIGEYDYSVKTLEAAPFTTAIDFLNKEPEPTMLVIPDAVEAKVNNANLATKYAACYTIQSKMTEHCALLQSRVSILDIPGGYEEVFGVDVVNAFREGGANPAVAKYNSYAAAYYPWLHSSILAASSVNYDNLDPASYPTIVNMVEEEYKRKFADADGNVNLTELNKYTNLFDASKPQDDATMKAADSVLNNLSEGFQLMNNAILQQLNLIAPSAGMAGLYTAVDNAQGVWIAPANIGMQSVIMPAVNIDHKGQEDLNMPLNGKAICAIRAFPGKGTLVWGARTLDGNSNDWRYINVRRTLIYLEESVKEAARAFVFAPNDAGTWVSMKSMINNFLVGVWKQGGLVGPSPDAAFSVSVGLGSTMSSDDILNGIMRITVLVAPSRPAEFIEITFQQQQQQA